MLIAVEPHMLVCTYVEARSNTFALEQLVVSAISACSYNNTRCIVLISD
jgi:hypothetical protein